MSRTTIQKIKETEDLNNTINQLNLIDICRTYRSTTIEYTFYLSAYGTFSRIDLILVHKTNLNKFKGIEIIQSVFFDHSGKKLEIKSRGNLGNT